MTSYNTETFAFCYLGRLCTYRSMQLKQAEFTIHRSDNTRVLYRAIKCIPDPGDETYRLSLHSLFASKTPQDSPSSKKLKIKNLKIPSGAKLEFCYIKYGQDEDYHKKWSCDSNETLKPDIKMGGIVKRP